MTDTNILETSILEQVRPNQVGPVMSAVPELIEKACEYSGGRFTPESVFEACTGPTPKWQMWVVFDKEATKDPKAFGKYVKVVTVTHLAVYPTGLKVAEVIIIGGRGPNGEWIPYIDVLKRWAKAEGCHRMQFIGRRGWKRVLSKDAIPSATLYEVPLTEANDEFRQQRH